MNSVKKSIILGEYTQIKINGTPFMMPKYLLETEFITSGIQEFDAIHDYHIDAVFDTKELFADLIEYLLYEYNDETIPFLNISPALSMFIDKYLKNHYYLLLNLCRRYERMMHTPLIDNRGILTNFIEIMVGFYVGSSINIDCMVECMQELFPDLMERLKKIFSGVKVYNLYSKVKNDHECTYTNLWCQTLRDISREYESFVPKIFEAMLKKNDITLEHIVPNIDYYNHKNITFTTTNYGKVLDEYNVWIYEYDEGIKQLIKGNAGSVSSTSDNTEISGPIALISHKNNKCVDQITKDLHMISSIPMTEDFYVLCNGVITPYICDIYGDDDTVVVYCENGIYFIGCPEIGSKIIMDKK